MKKILFLALLSAGLMSQAQTSIAMFHHNSAVAIAPNQTIFVTTLPGPDTTITKTVDIQNTSTVTNTYHVKRYDLKIHGVSVTDSAHANFCFGGQCYGTGTRLSLVSLQLIGGENSASFAQYYSLDADIIEASTVGYSLVKYTFFNENNVNDSVQFTIQYNSLTTGITRNHSTSYNMNVYPNPTSGSTNIHVSAPQAGEVTISMINAIGQQVYRNESKFVEGSNTLNLDVKDFPSGIYYVVLDTDNGTVTKKITVVK